MRPDEEKQEAADEHTDVLKTFARQILTSALACTLDGAEAQELAVALGLLRQEAAADGEEVDWTYHLVPWLREKETTTTDLGGCSG